MKRKKKKTTTETPSTIYDAIFKMTLKHEYKFFVKTLPSHD